MDHDVHWDALLKHDAGRGGVAGGAFFQYNTGFIAGRIYVRQACFDSMELVRAQRSDTRPRFGV